MPEARGLLGGNEAQAGYRWQGEPIKGSLWRRAMFESAATEFVLQFVLLCDARRTIPGGEEDRLLRPTKGAPASQFPWKFLSRDFRGSRFQVVKGLDTSVVPTNA